MLTTLWLLIAAHFVADYPGQGDFLAKAKNVTAPIPGVPWLQALVAHAFIHSGAVLLVTGSLWFAAIELVAHAGIDHAKCRGCISFNADQALHIACKVAYVVAMALAERGSDG